MEARGTLPAPAIGEHEAPDLAQLFERTGPFVTVYLDTNPEIENAAQRSLAHWKAVRRTLEAARAPARTLENIEALVADAHNYGTALGVVADASTDDVVLARAEMDPVGRDVGRFGTLPSVGPLIEEQQSSPAHIVVVCDRVGADIGVFLPETEGSGHSALLTIDAGDQHDPVIHKSKPGGWSQRRYQDRAENAWEQNAKQVVERLTKFCDIVEPRLVLVTGDVRAVQLLKEHLPERVLHVVQDMGRPDEAVTHVATLVAADTAALLQKFREEFGQRDRAVDGVDDTLAALCAARVDTLLVHDDPTDDRTCWFSHDPALVARHAQPLRDQGVPSPTEGRLVDAAIRTAFRTGARVRIVPATTVTDNVGALLRF